MTPLRMYLRFHISTYIWKCVICMREVADKHKVVGTSLLTAGRLWFINLC